MVLIIERGNRCQRRGRIVAKSVDLIGHHKIELTHENVHDHTIRLNPELAYPLCFDCHNKLHRRFGHQNQGCQVYLVYGPPLSGKTRRQKMDRGDLVVDVNLPSEAVTMLPGYDKPDVLLTVILGLRNQLIGNIRTRFGKWHNAWIVGGYGDKYPRDKLVTDLGAEPIFCDVSREGCLSRLVAQENLRHRKAEWKGYIEKWFESYME